jgi:hypothetical protein
VISSPPACHRGYLRSWIRIPPGCRVVFYKVHQGVGRSFFKGRSFLKKIVRLWKKSSKLGSKLLCWTNETNHKNIRKSIFYSDPFNLVFGTRFQVCTSLYLNSNAPDVITVFAQMMKNVQQHIWTIQKSRNVSTHTHIYTYLEDTESVGMCCIVNSNSI